MPTRGFINGGYYQDKLLAGGGTDTVVVSSPSAIYTNGGTINGVFGQLPFTSGFTQAGDLIVKNLTVNNEFLPGCINDGIGGIGCHKIICSGNLTLNTGGYITVNGLIPDGGSAFHTSSGPSRGYNAGSVGGSSGCAGGVSGNGGPFNTFESMFHMGGSGGTGAGVAPGTPGGAIFDSAGRYGSNVFQPSVYNDACIITNFSLEMSLSFVAEPVIIGRIFGGAGGAGCGSGISSPAAGGAGGGVVYISCDKLIMNGGVIEAVGQFSTTGGGGGGGVVIIVCSEVLWTSGSISVGGGASSLGGSGGIGRVLLFSNTLVASLSGATPGIIYKSDYDAALRIYQERS
jgi:hypothetical protein